MAIGSYGQRDARGELSGGLGADQAWRLAASWQESDGWRAQTGWQRGQAILRHRYSGERTQIDTIVTATDFDSEMASAQRLSVYRSDPRNDGFDPRVPRDRARDRAKYLRVSSEISHELDDKWRLQVTPYVRAIDASFMQVWQPAIVPITDEETRTAGLISRLYLDWSSSAETVFGVDIERTAVDELITQVLPTTVVFGDVFPQGAHYDYDVDYLNIAPYVQHTQQLGQAWQLILGLRYEDASYDYENHLPAGAADAFYRPASRKDDFSALNPKLGLTWTFAPGQNLFARHAHGFRIPSAASLYQLAANQTDFSLDPEQIDSYEVGYKGVFGSRVSLTASTYLMKSYDGLTTDFATLAGVITTNGGRREYRGIETQVSVRILDTLSATLAAAWQDSEISRDRPDGSDPRGVNGNTPRSQSDKLANLALSWTPSLGACNFAVDYDLQLLGSWWLDDQNTLRTPDEFISNLRLRADAGSRWAVTAKVLNLFDRSYAATAADEGFGARYRPGDPRTIVAGVEYTF